MPQARAQMKWRRLDSAPGFWLHAPMFIPATDADLAEAAALINVSYRGEEAELGWTHENAHVSGERISAGELADMLARRPGAHLLLRHDGTAGALVGCVWLEPRGEGVWYLGLLAVRPNLQNGGHGRAILEDCEALVQALGGQRIRLTVVHLRETLIAWYQRRGYVLTGESEAFPQPDRALRDLHLVVLERRLRGGSLQ